MSQENFLNNARQFLDKLNSAENHSQTVDLWRSTSFPYEMKANDPHSDAYRDEVLNVYKKLTGMSYDVDNEWTSTLQDPEDFELGYPWVSKHFNVIAEEIGKPIQVLRTLHALNIDELRLIEFGAGWANLSIPLAKSGINMTLVDIDRGFLDRAERLAAREGVRMKTICGDFNEVAQEVHGRFNVAVFQSSFHHCLDFERLIMALRTNILEPDGMILFVNEPISEELQFPWGLRYDGESLWAIMCNKWLELGFHSDFFAEMLLRNGMLPQTVPGIPSLVDQGWKATIGERGVQFSELRLPSRFSATFHEWDGATGGRFCRAISSLPSVGGSGMNGYDIEFVNHSLLPLQFSTGQGSERRTVTLASGERTTQRLSAQESPLDIRSSTFVPNDQSGAKDFRVLGVLIDRVALY